LIELVAALLLQPDEDLIVGLAWDLAAAYESRVLREAGARTVGGNSERWDSFVNGGVTLSLRARATDWLELEATARNARFRGDNAFMPGDGIGDRLNWGEGSVQRSFEVKTAFASFKVESCKFMVGLQDAGVDLLGRGDPLLLALGRAESPWGEIDNAWFGPVRNEEDFAGVHAAWSAFEAGALQSHRDGREEQVYFATGRVEFEGEFQGSVVAAVFDGPAARQKVWTVGIGAIATFNTGTQLFAEIFKQGGDATGLSWQLGGRMDFPGDTKVWAEVIVVFVSGFRGVADTSTGAASPADTREFLSYEDNDDLVILDSNEWGLDVDNNIVQIKVKGGIDLPRGIRLTGKIGIADAVEPYLVADPTVVEVEAYGIEFDARMEMDLTANFRVQMTAAVLFGADVFAHFNRKDEDTMYVFLLGTEGRF